MTLSFVATSSLSPFWNRSRNSSQHESMIDRQEAILLNLDPEYVRRELAKKHKLRADVEK
jgi:hypothetical protein